MTPLSCSLWFYFQIEEKAGEANSGAIRQILYAVTGRQSQHVKITADVSEYLQAMKQLCTPMLIDKIALTDMHINSETHPTQTKRSRVALVLLITTNINFGFDA